MKRVRALLRSGRFLVPVAVLLGEDGTLSILPRASVSESSRVRGSLSPREVSAVLPSRIDVSLRGCGFTVRRVRRRIELLNGEERRLIEHLDVDPSDLVKRGRSFYEGAYLIRIRIPDAGRDLTFVTDKRGATLLGSHLAKHCSE